MPLFPKNEEFFDKIDQAANNVLVASRLLAEFVHNDGMNESNLRRLEDKEHEGDKITDDTIGMLNKTFITPIDREDIHALICKLDDILDYIYGVANRMVLYRIGKPGEEFRTLADIVVRTAEEVCRTTLQLRTLKDTQKILSHCEEISHLENEADNAHRRAVANLFDKEKDPIQVIKMKEILDHMETATDKCQDVSDVIEGIVVKNA